MIIFPEFFFESVEFFFTFILIYKKKTQRKLSFDSEAGNQNFQKMEKEEKG